MILAFDLQRTEGLMAGFYEGLFPTTPSTVTPPTEAIPRVSFDLRDLHRMVSRLEPIANTACGRMSFYDSAFEPITEHPETVNLCHAAADAAHVGSSCCASCPLEDQVRKGSHDVIRVRCAMGVLRTVAPIIVGRQVIGWIEAPQQPEGSVFETCNLPFPPSVARIVHARLRSPISLDDIDACLHHATTVVTVLCAEERRATIVDQTTSRLADASGPREVISTLFRAFGQLNGQVDEYRFCVRNDHVVRILDGAGSHYDEEAATIGLGAGHIGLSLQSRSSLYERDLGSGDTQFEPTRRAWRPRTVLTIPLQWGSAVAGIQVQSASSDAFEKSDRYAMELLAARAGHRATTLIEGDRSLKFDDTSGTQADEQSWDRFLVELMLHRSASSFDLLSVRSSLYARFGAELHARAGRHAIATSIRILNASSDILDYVDARGPLALECRSRPIVPCDPISVVARAALRTGLVYGPALDGPSLTEGLACRSSWARRFTIHGHRTGVATVMWNTVDGGAAVVSQLDAAFTQFERMLAALSAVEEELVHGFESLLTGGQSLHDIGTELCEQIRRLLDARTCALFLDRHATGRLTLTASTSPTHDPTSTPAAYPLGEGIVGWVGKYRKTLRLRGLTHSSERVWISQPSRIELEGVARDDTHVPSSLLVTPLIAGNRTVGVIRVAVKQDLGDFTHEDETFLQDVSNRLASVIYSRWQTEDATARIRDLENRVSREASALQAGDLSNICRLLAEDAQAVAEAVGAYLIVDYGTARVSGTAGLFRRLEALRLDLPLINVEPVADIWQAPTWSSIAEAIDHAFGHDCRELATSGVMLPLSDDFEHWRGALYLVGHRPWHVRDHRLMDLVVRSTATVEHFVRQTRLREHLARLGQIGLRFNLHNDFDELMESILEASLKEARLTRGQIRLFDDARNGWQLVAQRESPDAPPIVPGGVALNRCVESRRAVVIANTHADLQWLEDAQERERATSEWMTPCGEIVIPMIAGQTCVGVISLQSPTEPAAPSGDTLQFLEVLAQYAAFAVFSATSYRRKLELTEPFAYVGRMLSGFLHTIGNKLNNARAHVPLLKSTRASEELKREHVAALERDIERVVAVIGDFRMAFDPRGEAVHHVDVNAIVQKVANDADMPRGLHTTIAVRLETPGPMLQCNAIELEIALKMLFQNAAEAIGSRYGTILFRTRSTRKLLLVTVADDGVGMDRETRRNCTRPFFTTKGTTAIGLGLAVAMGIVARHRGRLRIGSAKGRGTLCSLVFPRQARAEPI